MVPNSKEGSSNPKLGSKIQNIIGKNPNKEFLIPKIG
jgi:hypothetical protein